MRMFALFGVENAATWKKNLNKQQKMALGISPDSAFPKRTLTYEP
jgi:hypothetical protein